MRSSGVRWVLSLLGGLAVVAGCTFGVLSVKAAEPTAVPSIRAEQAMVQGGADPRQAGTFKDGHYAALGHYLTPGGNEAISVSVDVTAGEVTAATVLTQAQSPTARQFQDQFRVQIIGQVTGRDLSSLAVSRVSGASLTSLGFNDALARIRSAAKA